tara:strand:- start:313 stop:846 length:534 start_codon:yes stop_codon:yes gene_type:complete
MRKLLTIHLLCTVIFSQGLFDIIHQDDGKKINYYRKNGKKIELSRQEYYYKSGNMKAEGNYRNGEKEGRWTRYYKNTQIKEQGNYKSGNKVDRWVYYYDSGNIRYSCIYKGDDKDGQWTYYDGKGKLARTYNYNNDRFTCNNNSNSVPVSYINDSECDCSDCSDEPFKEEINSKGDW